MKQLLVLLCMSLWALAAWSANAVETRDITEPRGEAGQTGRLETITLATQDLDPVRLFYQDGLGLTLEGPLELPPDSIAKQRKLWRAPPELQWQQYRLSRPGTPDAAQIRVLLLAQPTPSQHQSWDSLQLGPFAIGFPNVAQDMLDKRMRRLGFGAQAPMQSYPVTRPDQSQYRVHETIFNGPDFVKAVGIERADPMPPLAPVDPESKLGGPGYSSVVVEDSDAMVDFFTKVLDFEVRADRVWKTSGALGAPAGTEYRFLLLYAKGSGSGHILMLDYQGIAAIDSGREPRLPNRGIVMWSFKTTALDATLKKAKAAKREVIGPLALELPGLGTRRAGTVIAPNGMLIELIEGL